MALRLHVVRSASPAVFHRLCLDEALYRDKQKRCWLVVDQVNPSIDYQPSIVLGLSGKVAEHVYEEKARQDNVQLLRRFTGGGTVSVDHNVFLISLICNASLIPPLNSHKAYPREIMAWTDEKVFRPAFDAVKLDRHAKFMARENDYVIDDRYKIGGNAQGISGDRFVHHTSFLWRVNPIMMSYLQMPTKRPEYREGRDHVSFLRGLEPYVASKQAFVDAVVDSYSEALMATELYYDPELPPMVEETRNRIL